MKVVCLALIFAGLSSAQRTANCTNVTTAITNKCDMIMCTQDSECASYDCNDNFCWDYNSRPKNCDSNP